MNEWIEVKDGEAAIDLMELIKLLLRKLWLIILATIICGGVAFAYAAFMITPMYQSSIKMYVNNQQSGSETTYLTSSDLVASQYLADTYAIVLKSYPTISEVSEKTGLGYSFEQLSGMIKTETVNETEIIRVTVTAADPEEAALIANTIAEVAPGQIMEVVTGSSVKIVENARVPSGPSSPSIKKYTTLGMVLGFVISVAGIILLSLIKNKASVEEKIRTEHQKAVLSVIPQMGGKKAKNAQIGDELNFAASEAYKLLRTNLAFCFTADQSSRVIGITSYDKAEGKSTSSVNLAYTLAQAGHKVCLLDCDMRASSISKVLRMKSSPGLSDLLVGKAKGSEVIQKYYVKAILGE